MGVRIWYRVLSDGSSPATLKAVEVLLLAFLSVISSRTERLPLQHVCIASVQCISYTAIHMLLFVQLRGHFSGSTCQGRDAFLFQPSIGSGNVRAVSPGRGIPISY
jgi:hypothetical protein